MNDNVRIWSIDLSKSWGATTRTEVEKKQHTEVPTYEVECELINTNEYLNSNSNNHILNSIIYKGLSLLGIPNSSFVIN